MSEEGTWAASALPEQLGLWKVSLATAGARWEELCDSIQPKPFWELVILWNLKIPAKRRAVAAATADGPTAPVTQPGDREAAAGSLPRNKHVQNSPVPPVLS